MEAGQEVAALDRTLLQAELDKARATREQKRLDLARLEGLVKRNAVSEDEIAQARTAYTVAQAEERLLETRLAYTRIQAPFAGVITQRPGRARGLRGQGPPPADPCRPRIAGR